MPKKIVVGTDGSPTAREAVREAAELAAVTGAELLIVRAYYGKEPRDSATAYEPTLEDRSPAGLPADVARPVGPRGDALAGLEADVASVAEYDIPVVTPLAREGEAADAILRIADEQGADLIVVGNKGMTGAARFLLGSVPNKITHHAPCNVLVVRTT
ncbi:universal stress protein [Paraconexibacter algicola]|uniref:Universal stress protein n=1 Tax=Paraconexibacter algicola TaxID=2133960 RepID=A0A2T4UEU6_9ACTN|nr:universal stress protein [Paraconexibacter algicola]PTL56300.1 universal stress protein [Paraconexibacter algicola]